MYRYWDGSAWSAALSRNPNAPAPSQGLVQGSASPQGGQGGPAQGGHGQPQGGHGQGAQGGYGQSGYGQSGYGQQFAPGGGKPNRSGAGWWIAAIAVLVGVAVVAALTLPRIFGGTVPGGPGDPGGQSTRETCPPQRDDTTPPPAPADGRVHAGRMSHPVLGPPWEAPSGDNRVPFGINAQTQIVPVEPNYDMGSSWVASVLIAELAAGDGFFSPKDGSEIVVKCITGAFYGEAEVAREDLVNEATTVDGHEAWLVESHLTFDIPKLRTKGELLIVVIVKTSETSSSLFYASIPDTTPELVQPARDAMSQLKVEG